MFPAILVLFLLGVPSLAAHPNSGLPTGLAAPSSAALSTNGTLTAVASIAGPVDETIVPDRVAFQGNVTGGTPPYDSGWVFGDGSSAVQGAIASHLFTEAGAFLVLFRVTDSVGATATSTVPLTLNNDTLPISPTATVTPDVGSSSANSTTFHYAVQISPGLPLGYNWSFGDGSYSHLPEPTHQFPAAGIYLTLLTLEVRAHFSADPSQTVWNTTFLLTVITANIFGPSTVGIEWNLTGSSYTDCSGLGPPFTVQLTAVGGGPWLPASSVWEFGDGTTGQGSGSVSHTYPHASVGYHVLLETSDASSNSATSSVWISGPPVPAGGSDGSCSGWLTVAAWLLGAVGLVAAVGTVWYFAHRKRGDLP
jgi:hypothetical protein